MKNLKEGTKGITLIALVVTIIVLLILVGVALGAVLGQDGIFNRAENATEKYAGSKARETLEMAFSALQMEKYEKNLTTENLDTRVTEEINKMGGEELEDKSQVVVDGYIFLVDRTIPKIIDELGPADGIVISAVVTQNGDWQNPKATVTGTINTYSGGTITTSTATATNDVTITGFPTNGGNFIIENIEKDTDITINATDSNGKIAKPRIVQVRLVRDNTPPTVERVNVIVDKMNIKISATGHDKNKEGKEESGIAYFSYTIEPPTGLENPTGTIQRGQELILKTTVTEDTSYTVKVTAMDNAGNGPSEEKTSNPVKVEIINGTKMVAPDGEWWLPDGFTESTDSSSTIKGGKVIEDKTGNQWVWIPCYLDDNGKKVGQELYENATQYKRTSLGGMSLSDSAIKESLDTENSKSIKKYGGFYIGRYEAGTNKDASSEDSTRTVYIQKNKIPYRWITPSNCIKLSKEFAGNNKYNTNKVYTKLVSSYAWDTALCFIQYTVTDYATNSIQGNYSNTEFISGKQLLNTGKTIAVCNIYDMGGNLDEYTSELCGASYIFRGGSYNYTSLEQPAGMRVNYNKKEGIAFGFRLTLYIK